MAGRGYALFGCAVLLLVPLSLVSLWLENRLTWRGATGWIIASALALALPPLLAGRRNER